MRKAIILGGTEDHIRLIEILKNKGYYTILIDFYENPPANSIADEHIIESTLDVDKVTSIAKAINPELVIAACIDQALLTMAYVCEKLKLPCHISYQTALELTNKVFMKRKFEENDIPTSRFIILENKKYKKIENLKFPIVIKPADSNSSKGITKVNCIDNLDDAVNFAFSHSRAGKVVIEEFVEGEEFSVDVAVKDFEPTLVMVTKNIKLKQNENNFTIVQSLYPATKENIVLQRIRDIAKKITLCYGIKNGPLLIQLIYNGNNLSVVEFSSRIGGGSKHHFIEKMTGFDMLKWFVEILISKTLEINVSEKFKFGCVNYIYAQNGIINEYKGFAGLKSERIIEQYYIYKPVGITISNHISSADRPAGYMIVDNSVDYFKEKIDISNREIEILDINGKDIVLKDYHTQI